jgi:uncharacterized repeat protein (TIGR03803 family)
MKNPRNLIAITLLFFAGQSGRATATPLTTLHSFSGTDGSFPYAGLVQGTDSNFYGTTQSGGTSSSGTVFRISPSGNFTNLYSFSGPDGATPSAGLVQGNFGYLYGTTEYGGIDRIGTIFQISPTGSFASLHSFNGSDGAYPAGGGALVLGSDGYFYGTTTAGGTNSCDCGTVFKMLPTGILIWSYSFTGSPGGANPYDGLVQGSDSNFYGTTYAGGTNGVGTVFRISPLGSLTNLYTFSGSDGATPFAGLVQGSDSNFYGTTYTGGTNGLGTVFVITPSGSLTTLHNFSGYPTDGGLPVAGLVQASDGNFYGTTRLGGTNDGGSVFEITPSGGLTTLYSFSGNDGANPEGGLVQGIDGYLYGTTYYGGTSASGTVFQLVDPCLSANTQSNILAVESSGARIAIGYIEGAIGFSFVPTENLTVTQVGYLAENQADPVISFWTGTNVMASYPQPAPDPSSTNQMIYAGISPLSLTAGQQYAITLQDGSLSSSNALIVEVFPAQVSPGITNYTPEEFSGGSVYLPTNSVVIYGPDFYYQGATTAPPPDLSIHIVGTNAVLRFSTICNGVYDIESTTNLVSSPWSAIASGVLGTDGVVTYIDIGGATVRQRFYRVGVQQ